jgi:hypothetical protein
MKFPVDNSTWAIRQTMPICEGPSCRRTGSFLKKHSDALMEGKKESSEHRAKAGEWLHSNAARGEMQPSAEEQPQIFSVMPTVQFVFRFTWGVCTHDSQQLHCGVLLWRYCYSCAKEAVGGCSLFKATLEINQLSAVKECTVKPAILV